PSPPIYPLSLTRRSSDLRPRHRECDAIRPVARSQRRGVLRQRGVRVTATDDGPSLENPDAPRPAEWRLPRLRVDVDGDWYDDDRSEEHTSELQSLAYLVC